MKLTKQQQESQELTNVIISKCWEDETFKQKFISNPEQTIFDFTGKKLNMPKGKEFIVNDQTNNNKVYFNIPPKPDLESMELSDEQLELVAGGLTPTFIIAAGVLTGYLLAESKK